MSINTGSTILTAFQVVVTFDPSILAVRHGDAKKGKDWQEGEFKKKSDVKSELAKTLVFNFRKQFVTFRTYKKIPRKNKEFCTHKPFAQVTLASQLHMPILLKLLCFHDFA